MNNMFQVSDIRSSWPSCCLFVMTCICCTLCTLSIFLLKSSKLRLICWICLLWILSTSFNAFCLSFSKLFMFSGKDLFVCIKYSSNISLSRENVCSSVAILKLVQVSWTDFMLHALCYRTEQTSQTRKKMITTILVFSVLLVLATNYVLTGLPAWLAGIRDSCKTLWCLVAPNRLWLPKQNTRITHGLSRSTFVEARIAPGIQ